MSETAFTQWECEMVVYRADEAGAPTGEIEYLGGCENKLEIEQGYAEERAERSGDGYARNQHLEETHVIQLENLWLTRYRKESGEEFYDSPRIGRAQRFVVVMLWTDEESGVWHKRSYYGVQINPLNFNSSQEYFSQTATMRASYYVPDHGRRPEEPTLQPTSLAFVRYVTSSGSVDLLSYDFDARTFTALANPAGKVDLPGAGGGYLARILVGGVLALAIDADGVLLVKEIVATGGSFTSGLPRAEFFHGNLRYASLTAAGLLAVPNFLESPATPGLTDDFEFREGGLWRLSLGLLGAYAPAIEDSL